MKKQESNYRGQRYLATMPILSDMDSQFTAV